MKRQNKLYYLGSTLRRPTGKKQASGNPDNPNEAGKPRVGAPSRRVRVMTGLIAAPEKPEETEVLAGSL